MLLASSLEACPRHRSSGSQPIPHGLYVSGGTFAEGRASSTLIRRSYKVVNTRARTARPWLCLSKGSLVTDGCQA